MRSPLKTSFRLLLAALLTVSLGCERDDSTVEPAEFPSQADVFTDGFTSGLDYQAFSGSKLDALVIDNVDTFEGSASMRFTVPDGTDPAANFAGGAFVLGVGRDLSGYDALTFYAKASMPAVIGVAGLGNDNTGTSRYTVERAGIAVGTSWEKFSVPIPDPERLGTERGLFHFAAGAVNNQPYTLWFDEVTYESSGTIIDPELVLNDPVLALQVGDSYAIGSLDVTFDDLGAPLTVTAMPGYFDFASSNPAVATVDMDGMIQAVGAGHAEVTVALGGQPADGSFDVTVGDAQAGPTTPAAAPTFHPAEVIALFSDTYTTVTVDTWSAEWDDAEVEDLQIAGDNVKLYSDLVFAGIEFASSPVDASAMTHFHLQIWTPDEVDAASEFKLKLVDFGPDGAFDGGDDSESEITLTPASTPALAGGSWLRYDIPLEQFSGLAGTSALAQLILSGSLTDVYVDNILFHSGDGGGNGGGDAPSSPAPAPGYAPGNVIALFSDGYSEVPVNTWSAEWDDADLEETDIDGNAVKLYTNTVFGGIEFTSPPVDASAMTHFRMDIWTPESTDPPAIFKIKLVDFGPNGSWDGGGDDTEHELTFNAGTTPALHSGQWVTFDLPLDQFTGMTGRSAVAQLIFVSDPGPNTIYVDNVLFHN